MKIINGIPIEDTQAAEKYAIEKMGKDATRRFVDIAYSQWFDRLKAEYASNNNKAVVNARNMFSFTTGQKVIWNFGKYDHYFIVDAKRNEAQEKFYKIHNPFGKVSNHHIAESELLSYY